MLKKPTSNTMAKVSGTPGTIPTTAVATTMTIRDKTITPSLPQRLVARAPSGLPSSCAAPSPATRYTEIDSPDRWTSCRKLGVHTSMPTPMARAGRIGEPQQHHLADW